MQHLIQALGDQDALGPVQKGVGVLALTFNTFR